MALSNFPYKINNTALPFPTSWSVSPDIVETVKQSEGGTDMVMVVRRNKRKINVSYKIADSDWLKKLLEFYALDSLTVQQFNPLNNAYESMTMRMRGFTYTPVRKSHELTAVTGVWDISFSLEEY